VRVVLLLNVELVERRVDGEDVGLLHRQQVLLDDGQVAELAHEVDDARVVDARYKYRQQLAGSQRLGFQVELDGLVADLEVRDLDDHVLEEAVVPSVDRVLDHGKCGAVVFVVLDVQEGQLCSAAYTQE